MQVAHSQQPAMQMQMPMRSMVVAQKPKKVDGALLATCDSLLDSIHLCIHLSKLPHYAIAERLGIDRGHWTRMMQAQAHFPTNKLKLLQEVCGNYAPLQYQNMECGFEMYEDAKQKRVEELRRELAQLDSAAA